MTKDKRPRYGWCASLNSDPQIVFEDRPTQFEATPVVVIPLVQIKNKRKLNEFIRNFLVPLTED